VFCCSLTQEAKVAKASSMRRQWLIEPCHDTIVNLLLFDRVMCAYASCRDFLKAYCLQLAIMANHQNGRDTHVRGIKVFAPQQDAVQPLNQDIGFSTVQFSQYANLR